MKKYYVPKKVKSEALKKWGREFKSMQEFYDWMQRYGIGRCSFCHHFMRGRYVPCDPCNCPLQDFPDECAVEFQFLVRVHLEDNPDNVSLKKINHMVRELYLRIKSL